MTARRIAATLSLLCGAALLLLVAPHRNPWDMTRVLTARDPATVGLRLLGATIELPLGLVLAALAIPLPVALIVWAARTAPLGERRRLAALAGGLAVLLFSMAPHGRGLEVVLFLAAGALAIALLTAGVVGAWPAATERAERARLVLAGWLHRGSPAMFGGVLFAFVLVAAAAACSWLFGRVPHVIDSADQLLHAKMFALGHATVPAPRPAEFFSMTHMILGDRWYSQYPPGHTLLLAVGWLLRAPWLVNPVCGATSVVLLYRVGSAMYDETTGRIAGLLAAVSPFVLLMSGSFMSHTTTLCALALFWLGAACTIRGGGWRRAALAGAALGFAVTIRPLTAVALSLPFGLWFVAWAVGAMRSGGREKQATLAAVVALVVACAVPVAGLLAFNQATNGSPLVFGYEVLHGKEASIGFGKTGWGNVPHSPLRGLQATLRNLNAWNQYLFGFPAPSLAVALIGLAWVRWRREDAVLLGSVAALVAAYFFYWYQDWAMGPRFVYSASGPMVLLTARALAGLPRVSRETGRPVAATVAVALALCFGLGLALQFPVLAGYYSRNHADGNRRAWHRIDAQEQEGSLVFVPGYYMPVFLQKNAPLLDGDAIYARDLGPAHNRALLAAHADRRPFKIVSLADYELVPYSPTGFPAEAVFPVVPGRPLTVEALTFQVAHVGKAAVRDQRTAAFGPGWKNHDHLRLAARDPGAEVGMLFEAERPETRVLNLVLSGGPRNGRVEIWWDTRPLGEPVDLYAERERPIAVRREGVRLNPGRNGLLLRVVGRNERARGHGMGVDVVSLTP